MNLPRWTAYVALAVIAILLASAIPGMGGSDPAPRNADELPDPENPRVVVLGIDGMDPDILQDVMRRYPDRMTNFARLAGAADGVRSLGTSTPPQSPVAWSNFITGRNPGGHGIYDFIHRDPKTYGFASPTMKSSHGSELHVPLSDYKLPLGGSNEPNRSGKAFWTILKGADVAADLYRVPINFPVEPSKGVSFPGMLTPALDSAYGTYTIFTTNPPAVLETNSGKYRNVRVVSGAVRTNIEGPANSLKKGDPAATTPLTIYVDEDKDVAVLEVGDDRVIMRPGEWSKFMGVHFDLLPMGAMGLDGIVCFYLRSISPEFELYCSPVNFDPKAPADVISLPEDAAADLAEAIGPYFTQGMAEEVGALKDEGITDAEFMAQADLIYRERVRMLDYALDRYTAKEDGGLLFFYVSSVDLAMHMMWRHQDPDHPFYDEAIANQDSSWWSGRDGSTWSDVVDDLYLKMDPILGKVLDRVGDDALVMVMSDHGFAPYRRKFSLNTWLLENGYLVLNEGAERELALDDPAHSEVSILSAVDWTKTKAYGMGFNGLYLNMKDREEHGIVSAGAEADGLLDEIAAGLEAVMDQGVRVVLEADRADVVYAGGERVSEAPDIVVGYNSGYGNSDEASIGRIPHAVLSDNTGGTFNGSHLMHPSVVNGVLLSNRPVTVDDPRLEDLTVSILKEYGVKAPEEMVGRPVFQARGQ